MQGLLRVRTCPELQVMRFYGAVVADESHDSLAHVALADPGTTCAFDVRHARQSQRLETQQCMQMVFKYTVFVPAAPGRSSKGSAPRWDSPHSPHCVSSPF